mgnify:CR=1 FL=1
MEKERQTLEEEKHFEDIKSYWEEILDRVENGDYNGVKRLLLQRADFSDAKMPGEDEIMLWLQDEAVRRKEQTGLELNEKGIISPSVKEKE